MHRGSLGFLAGALIAAALPCLSQVLSPPEILDPSMRALQQKHLPELKAAAVDISTHQYPYKFYLSRKLDVTEKQEQLTDQRSILFSNFQGRTVVQVTGNYFAAYAEESMDRSQRVEQTYVDVMLPILRAMASRLNSEPQLKAFAIEVAHHVRKKVLGVTVEHPENIALIVPSAVAFHASDGNDVATQLAVLKQSSIYVDSQPVALWPGTPAPANSAGTSGSSPTPAQPAATAIGKPPAENALNAQPPAPPAVPAASAPVPAPAVSAPAPSPAVSAPAPAPAASAPALAPAVSALAPAPAASAPAPAPSAPASAPAVSAPARDPAPRALQQQQASFQDRLDKLVRDLDSQAHFVSYAPPTLIAFHNSSYLQLSLTTPLGPSDSGSQYRLAALAFDRHISHLIRPVLAIFQDDSGFDGIVFSSTVKIQGQNATESATAQSVEFFFALGQLRSYEQFDITGQQLINSGFVLINGERVGLELQSAEGANK